MFDSYFKSPIKNNLLRLEEDFFHTGAMQFAKISAFESITTLNVFNPIACPEKNYPLTRHIVTWIKVFFGYINEYHVSFLSKLVVYGIVSIKKSKVIPMLAKSDQYFMQMMKCLTWGTFFSGRPVCRFI